jgi:hypothetical protein
MTAGGGRVPEGGGAPRDRAAREAGRAAGRALGQLAAWRRVWGRRLRLAALVVFAAVAARLSFGPALFALRGCGPGLAGGAALDAASAAVVAVLVWAAGGLWLLRPWRRWTLAAEVLAGAVCAANVAVAAVCR